MSMCSTRTCTWARGRYNMLENMQSQDHFLNALMTSNNAFPSTLPSGNHANAQGVSHAQTHFTLYLSPKRLS